MHLYPYYDANVNIYNYPTPDVIFEGQPGEHLVIGDLHGNVIKLLYLLVRHGIMKEIKPTQYEILVELYWKGNNLTREDLLFFYDLVNMFEFVSECKITLIGDELADRGNSDYLTLLLIKVLRQKNVIVSTLLSNHSYEAITRMEEAACAEANLDNALTIAVPMESKVITNADSLSLLNTSILLANNVITQSDLVKRYRYDYSPTLQLLSYMDTETGIAILSHAPIGLNTIKGIASSAHFNIPFQAETIDELKGTIDAINAKFTQYVQQYRVQHLCFHDVLVSATINPNLDMSDFPIEACIWNRRGSTLEQPKVLDGRTLTYIHGHNNAPTTDHTINLNTRLGQATTKTGEYIVYFQTDRNLDEQAAIYRNNPCNKLQTLDFLSYEDGDTDNASVVDNGDETTNNNHTSSDDDGPAQLDPKEHVNSPAQSSAKEHVNSQPDQHWPSFELNHPSSSTSSTIPSTLAAHSASLRFERTEDTESPTPNQSPNPSGVAMSQDDLDTPSSPLLACRSRWGRSRRDQARRVGHSSAFRFLDIPRNPVLGVGAVAAAGVDDEAERLSP